MFKGAFSSFPCLTSSKCIYFLIKQSQSWFIKPGLCTYLLANLQFLTSLLFAGASQPPAHWWNRHISKAPFNYKWSKNSMRCLNVVSATNNLLQLLVLEWEDTISRSSVVLLRRYISKEVHLIYRKSLQQPHK